jgi:hypothetical protein
MKKNLAVTFLFFSMVFISCDQDFNTIGADLVGDEHFDFDAYSVQNIKAYSVSTGEVQTNNLPINPLGFYNNPYFGETKANFVTQAALTAVQPDFGTDVKVENVTLYVPYFSKLISTNSNNESTYVLDSIYGANKESKMKLSVYENGYFINNLDASSNFEDQQRYYNNSTSNSGSVNFEGLKIGNDGGGLPQQDGTRLNDSSDPSENDQFFFNKEEVVIYNTKLNTTTGVLEYVNANGAVISPQTDVAPRVVKARLAPGIFITLNREYFKKRILEASSNVLFSNNDFRQYFKGLYFKMEQIAGEEGAMAMLNFNSAILNINFNSKNTGTSIVDSKTFSIKLGVNGGGNTVSLQDFTPSTNYSSSLSANLDQTTGQNASLFVKGGEGSVVYMDIFGEPGSNGVPVELEEIRKKGWLINDAYLEVYVDKTAMSLNSKAQEPERLYLFDATNQKPLADYSFDTSLSSNSKRSKFIFGGIVERDASGKAVKYKIRITQHINNIINSTNFSVNKNVKLGLCVVENIGLVSNYFYKTPQAFVVGPNIKIFPVSSIIAQQGVVLHGTGSADTEKRLKLTIHYTKPN